ncbi:MAG: hypothetical protein ACUVUS_10105 [Thermoproteota archaeon]
MRNGMTRLSILFFSLTMACISLLTISAHLFLMGMYIWPNLFCPSCANVSYKVVFPHSVPEVINTTQAFINKFNRSPKTFPYERVEVEPQVKKALMERFPFQEIATFKITNDHYVTIFLTDKPNYYHEVSWMLSEGKINILDEKTQEGIFILKTTYSKSYKTNETIHYEIKGEATYYEISIQINSMKYIEGTIYHTYDWTTTYAYLGSNLIYSVTASGDFYWNYGVEVWVHPSASHQTHFPLWAPCWLNKEAFGQYTVSCYVEAVGRASALLYYVPPFVSVNFKNTADVAHDCWGGENHWGYVDFYHSYGLPCM